MADEIEAAPKDAVEQDSHAEERDSVLDYQNLDDNAVESEVEAHCISLISVQNPGF